MTSLKYILVAACAGAITCTAVHAQGSSANTIWPAPEVVQVSGDVAGTHDPSIAEDHGTYYIFATGTAYAPVPPGSPAGTKPVALGQFPLRCSKDLHERKR